MFSVETLDDCVMLAISASLRYAYDTNNFFDTAGKKEIAANELLPIQHPLPIRNFLV